MHRLRETTVYSSQLNSEISKNIRMNIRMVLIFTYFRDCHPLHVFTGKKKSVNSVSAGINIF